MKITKRQSTYISSWTTCYRHYYQAAAVTTVWWKWTKQLAGQWAQVETAYQRRADLIPNLVNTVKGYADFEKETLTQVIEARAKATSVNINPENLDPAAIQQFQAAQDGLSSALSRLMVVVERYPDLKANQNFLDLQQQLESTENRIAVERRKFNDPHGTTIPLSGDFPKTF